MTNEKRAHDLTMLILQNQDRTEAILKVLNKLDVCIVSIDEDTEQVDIVKAYAYILEDILRRLG